MKLTVQQESHKVINVIIIKQPVIQDGHHNLPGYEVDRPTRPPAPGFQGDLSGETARREAGNDHKGRTEVVMVMVMMMVMLMMMAMMIIKGGLR